MQIRKATGEEMLALWGYPDEAAASPTAKFYYRNIRSGNAVFWTVDDSGELIGELYAFLDLDDRDFADGESTAYLCAFRVKEGYRGQGLGSQMMNAALADLKERGFRTATIGVGCDKPQNIRLYRRFGFDRKVKDCHYDPCGMDEDGRPEYEEEAWWLLARDLSEEQMCSENEKVRLVKIDTDNFDDLIELSVTDPQKDFVASNVYSLAEAYATNAEGNFAQPFGIYAGEKPVGFLMIGYFHKPDKPKDDEEEETPDYVHENYLFWRFMIDKEHQQKGYGREAMKLALDYIRTFPCGEAEYCWLSYEPENEVARKLYRSFGFVEAEQMPRGWDEIPALLKL